MPNWFNLKEPIYKAWDAVFWQILILIFLPFVGPIIFGLFFPLTISLVFMAHFPKFKQGWYLIPILYFLLIYEAYYSLGTEDYRVLDVVIEINRFIPCLLGYADTVLLTCSEL